MFHQNLKKNMGFPFRNENANPHYTTEFITNLFSEEGKGVFTTRQNVLGHMQQGGSPSPFDRNYGTKIAAKAVALLDTQVDQSTTPEGKLSPSWENLFMPYANNRGADQLAHTRSLISTSVVCCLDSMISRI